MYKYLPIAHTIFGVMNLNQKNKEEMVRQESHNRFNSVTQKQKPENQNQTHNVREEGIKPINQKR